MLPAEVLFAALTSAIGVLFWSLIKAKDDQIHDLKEERDGWRDIAVAGTSLARDAIEAPLPARRAKA